MLRRVSDVVLINRLKLRYLQFLIQIDEERSISAVAAMTDVSQPAATKLLREVEGILDKNLRAKPP
ncbi:MAG: LysR family transcriptional regulator [Devosiaceae bacterium]|nr:LysR family transcriptional regulator [Devosiaceae bacterium MH13]